MKQEGQDEEESSGSEDDKQGVLSDRPRQKKQNIPAPTTPTSVLLPTEASPPKKPEAQRKTSATSMKLKVKLPTENLRKSDPNSEEKSDFQNMNTGSRLLSSERGVELADLNRDKSLGS